MPKFIAWGWTVSQVTLMNRGSDKRTPLRSRASNNHMIQATYPLNCSFSNRINTNKKFSVFLLCHSWSCRLAYTLMKHFIPSCNRNSATCTFDCHVFYDGNYAIVSWMTQIPHRYEYTSMGSCPTNQFIHER